MPVHCLLATLAIGLLAASARADPVEVAVLSYNTHGLAAWVAGDDPEARFPEISKRLNRYDVALIQEDWEYHELLREHAEHRVVERGNGGPLLAGVIPLKNGSGLTTLLRFEPGRVGLVVREPYGVCSGWLGGANDCLVSKGFLLLRLRLAADVEVDLVQTHLDAGGAAEDRRARELQLAGLAARLRELSAGRALVVAGDFNLNYAVARDRSLLEGFIRELGLTDSGARARGAAWKRIDYILVRSGNEVALEVAASGEAREFVHEGVPLSDHPALFARLRLQSVR